MELRVVEFEQPSRERRWWLAEGFCPTFHRLGRHPPEPVLYLGNECVVLEAEPVSELHLRQTRPVSQALKPATGLLSLEFCLRFRLGKMHRSPPRPLKIS